MNFLNPILLWAAAAVAVPIIIHLLHRRKFQRVVWAAMRFLKTSVEQNQRRMRLEDIILLALRCLLLALLALALARPVLPSATSERLGAAVTGVLILDNSYSMSQTDGVSSRFDKARAIAEQVVDSLPPSSFLAVFLGSDIASPAIPEPTHDMHLARKAIREARISGHATDWLPVLKQAVETCKKSRGLRREIFLVTDTQALGWRQMPEIKRLLAGAKKDGIRTRILFIEQPEDNNLGVSRFRLASGLTPINQPLRFEIQVNNFGKTEVRQVKVNLSLDDGPPVDETLIDVLPARASRSVSLFARLRSEGYHSATARIPADRLPADDQRSLALRGIGDVRVLLVDGDPGAEPRESQVFFLKHALQPVPPAEAARYFIKAATAQASEFLNVSFDDYDAIILAGVSEIPASRIAALEQFVRRGGGLMIFPGPATLPTAYNEQLLRKNNLLPAAFGQLRGDASREDTYFLLQDKDYAHPLVEIWNDPASGTLGTARFFKYFELIPAPWPLPDTSTNAGLSARQAEVGEPRVVLRFTDGSPAVMERTWGQGRVLLFCSTANSAWNDLPVRPAFVPLVHRALGALVQRQDESLNLRVGERFVFHPGNEYLGRDVIITPPGIDRDSRRELRRVDFVHGLPTIRYEETDYNGIYEVAIASEVGRTLKFAAQPDAAESDLNEISGADRTALQEVAQVLSARPGMNLKEMLAKDRQGTELWLPVLLAVVALALLETFLAQHFSRSK